MTIEYSGPERRRGGPDRRNPDQQTKIMLVDDHALFRMGMRQMLEQEDDLDIVAEAEDARQAFQMAVDMSPDIVLLDLSLPAPGGIETTQRIKREVPSVGIIALAVAEADDTRSAFEAAQQFTPDIVLMDLSLPSPGGIETTQRVKREVPSAGIIALAVNEDEDQLFEAIKAGAAAFILKEVSPEDLVTIIRRVGAGEYLINDKVFSRPSVASRVLKEFRELAVYGQEAAPIFAPLSPREVEILDNIAQGMTNKQVAYALSISEQTVKNHMSSILRKLSVNDRTQAVVYAMKQGWIRVPED